MDKVRQAKHEHAMEHWKKVILTQKASGLTCRAFCKREHIRPNRFYYWQHEIQRELLIKKEKQQERISAPAKLEGALSQESEEDKKTVPAKSVQFVPLKPAKPVKKKVAHHLEIQCGPAKIVVSEDTPPDLLRQTLCVLRDVFLPC
nr:hypothetical protein [uncultured Mitsuokella sp.]